MMRQALLLSILAVSGCGPNVEVGARHSSSSASSSGAGGAGAMGGNGGAGGGGLGGFGGSVALCTPPDGPSMPAPLCGPSDISCNIEVEEVLPVPNAYRNDAPALALNETCSPEILFASAIGEYLGFYALRQPAGDWNIAQTPFAYATGGLVRAPNGLSLALANDGAFGASLWGFSAEGWNHVSDIPSNATHAERSFAQGPDGVLYAGIINDIGDYELGTFANQWSMQHLGNSSTIVPVAVSPEGKPHAIAWESPGSEWQLRWQSPPSPPEVIYSLGPNGLGTAEQRVVFGVTSADANNSLGKPHVLAVHVVNETTTEIVYHTRVGPGAWVSVSIETAFAPNVLWPLGVVTDELDNVRFFYSRTSDFLKTDGQVVIGWRIADQTIGRTDLLTKIKAISGTFRRDGAGRIHAALYSFVDTGDFDVRYVRLGH